MRILRALILIPLLFAIACTYAFGSPIRWQVTRTTHFILHCSKGDEATAKRAGSIAEEWYGKLSVKFGAEPGVVTPVYLYPERRSFSDATGADPGDPIVGIAHSKLLDIKVDASGAYQDISRIIPHELVHIFVSRKLRGNYMRLPLWANEGIAKYFAHDWSPDDAELLVDAVSDGDILPWYSISASFPKDRRARSIAYVQSYSVIRHTAKKYTEESIIDLLTELEKGELFDKAVYYSLGMTPQDWESEWRQYVFEEYRSDRWFHIATTLASAVMALLAVLAYHARRVQKHRKAQEFEEAESEETSIPDGSEDRM